MRHYTTIFDKIYHQGHFKVMATNDLDDFMTLKRIFLSAIQGLACTSVSDSDFRLLALLDTLQ